MNATDRPVPGTTYRLLEMLPYPRADRRGRLQTAGGEALHGAYQRRVPGGYQAALINNGTVLHRYRYQAPAAADITAVRHSFANLVLAVPGWWQVPADARRPVTNHPADEYPHATLRSLWTHPQVMGRLLAGRKPAGVIAGHPDLVETWRAQASAAGLVSRVWGRWTNGLGQPHVVATVAHPGPVATEAELEHLERSYRDHLDPWAHTSALAAVRTLGCLTGEQLLCRDLVNPATVGDLVITGHAFGYPPVTTAACITGTHA